MESHEAVRIDVLAGRGNRAEALEGRFDRNMRRARQPGADLARLRGLLARGDAGEEASKSREVRARLPSPAHLAVEAAYERFGAVSATGEDVDPHGFVALHCARGKVAELAGWLLEKGAERVSVAALEQTFAARNALYEALEKRIAPAQV